jgi:hypothetical protein
MTHICERHPSIISVLCAASKLSIARSSALLMAVDAEEEPRNTFSGDAIDRVLSFHDREAVNCLRHSAIRVETRSWQHPSSGRSRADLQKRGDSAQKTPLIREPVRLTGPKKTLRRVIEWGVKKTVEGPRRPLQMFADQPRV